MRKQEGEPWEHVEQARRIAARRFAREVGRDPSTVFSVAISAESALKEGATAGLARRFASETEKLFRLLRHERALILGTRSAAEVRRCIGRIVEAEGDAERAYEERIAMLEAHRIPDPEDFRATQVNAMAPAIEAAAADAARSARDVLRDSLALVRAHCAERIDACSRRAELKSVMPSVEQVLRDGFEKTRAEMHAHLATHAERSAVAIEQHIFEELRRRYELVHDVTRTSGVALELDALDAAALANVSTELSGVADRAVKSFVGKRVGFGLGGAAAGAAIGTAIVPILGTAIGAAVGALFTFAGTFSSAKAK